MTNNVSYSTDIENKILANLDGWRIGESSTGAMADETISPFMTAEESFHRPNKVITCNECRLFYEEALDMAYMYTNRLNVNDLSNVEFNVFLRAVCKWAASNLWNKYNIRVNNEDMEDAYIQSYGGLLYKSALKTLQPFINQRFSNLSDYSKDDDESDIWIV